MRRLVLLLCAACLAAACSEPPQKELDRAQGAIDAARAAGAAQYAPDSFAAATTALDQAHAAVGQRDYRLALSLAVDANERAQAAASEAAEARARTLGQREQTIAAIASGLKELERRITAAEAARVPDRSLEAARTTVTATKTALQEARALLGKVDYDAAGQRLEGRIEAIRAQIAAVDAAIEARTTPAQRRRR